MELYWTPEAVLDREAIYDYIEADNPKAAIALDESFEAKAVRLLDHPHIGRKGRVQNTRELIVHQNYILVYDVLDASVRILRVLHSARMWPLGK
ncbi:MAG: type II toxin-antitoxin system RelE/ParE family toxin [Pelistega sp.]|nr:type II toxin-antitoxin system RelE/ParE family toxin [Pelistega sp.]